MKIEDPHLSLIVETSEWLEWIQRKIQNNRLTPLPDEIAVLFAVRAIQYVNELEPTYGFLPARLRSQLIRSAIVHQCCSF
jgi:hypothetical protein